MISFLYFLSIPFGIKNRFPKKQEILIEYIEQKQQPLHPCQNGTINNLIGVNIQFYKQWYIIPAVMYPTKRNYEKTYLHKNV